MPSSLIVPGGRPEPTTPEPEAPAAPAGPIECVTAFAVYQLPEYGEWRLATIDADLVALRALTPDDLTAGCSNLLSGRGSHTFYHPDEPTDVVTLFVLFQLPNGLWQVADKIDAPLVPGREPNRGDVIGACAVTMRDTQTREVIQGIIGSDFGPAIVQSTTQSVIGNMGLIGQQMAQAKESAAVAAELERDKHRRGGR